MAHAQKPDFVFRRNGRVHLNRRGRQFSRLLAAEMCASAVVMLDTPCSEVVCRVLATHFIRHFPLHFPLPASPCAITLQLWSTLPYSNDRSHVTPRCMSIADSLAVIQHTTLDRYLHHKSMRFVCLTIEWMRLKYLPTCTRDRRVHSALLTVKWCVDPSVYLRTQLTHSFNIALFNN
jgi:hypothetical protein